MARIFVSDVHLDARAPQATARFLEFLRTTAAGAEALYVLGDLFEAWVGDDDRSEGNASVCAALRRLTDSGVPVFALHGNRDFLLGEGFCQASGVVLLPDPVIARLADEPVLLTHGDLLCTGDHDYQELRSIVRDPRWQARFLHLPLAERELLAGEARAGSRRHTARTVPVIMDVDPEAVRAACRAAGVRRLVHGHTHRPGVHDFDLDGVPAQRLVLGAWYEGGSWLECGPGGWALRAVA